MKIVFIIQAKLELVNLLLRLTSKDQIIYMNVFFTKSDL